MDKLERFEKVAQLARQAKPPTVQVTAQVMAAIRKQKKARRAWLVVASVAAAASLLLCFFAADHWDGLVKSVSKSYTAANCNPFAPFAQSEIL